jgi:hypothetical protein
VKLEKYKYPDGDQIPADQHYFPKVHKAINNIWIKEDLPSQLKEPIIIPVYKSGYITVVIIM